MEITGILAAVTSGVVMLAWFVLPGAAPARTATLVGASTEPLTMATETEVAAAVA